ncbi:MAG: dimethylargininase [Chlamydiia bacterium]|nr:dimethylargininase [Chlamydiia bacterium]
MRSYSSLITLLTASASLLGATPHFYYNHALVRQMSDSFCASLHREEPEAPIDLALARQQHEAYSLLIRALIADTATIGQDPEHPDCNFIEDTAILVGEDAVVCRMGAPERRGEEQAILETLLAQGRHTLHCLEAPATLDGGDVLYTGRHLFVGLSERSNAAAIEQLTHIFQGRLEVIAIPVGDSLHLKSLVSQLDEDVLVISQDEAGRAVQEAIEAQVSDYAFVSVPDRVAANVLRIRDTLVIQEGFPESECLLRSFAEQRGLHCVALPMSELIKADGALTCGSLLFQ